MNPNDSSCSPACPSSSKKGSPGGRSRTRTHTRTNVASVSRSPLQVDEVTLNAMMTNLETFGHGLGQFADEDRRARAEQPRHFLEHHFTPPDTRFAQEPEPQYAGPAFLDEAAGPLWLVESEMAAGAHEEKIASERRESLIEWFDRAVEKELDKRRDIDPMMRKSACAKKAEAAPKSPGQRPQASRGLAEASAGGVEIIGELLHERDADLIEAAEKLATAEAMCNFAGAVEAAEEAAKSVPLDCAEEAAAAGARGYQREITNVVQQTIPGEHPIEVVGYVGVTRPKNPIRRSDH